MRELRSFYFHTHRDCIYDKERSREKLHAINVYVTLTVYKECTIFFSIFERAFS